MTPDASLSAVDADPVRQAWLPLYADVLRHWLGEGRALRLPIAGASMRPALDGGTEVLIAACEPAAIRMGDVVVYEDGAHLVCHRVLRRQGRRRLLMKGDAVDLPATWIPASAVIGRVVAVEAGRGARVSGAWRTRLAGARAWARVIQLALVRTVRRTFGSRHAA